MTYMIDLPHNELALEYHDVAISDIDLPLLGPIAI